MKRGFQIRDIRQYKTVIPKRQGNKQGEPRDSQGTSKRGFPGLSTGRRSPAASSSEDIIGSLGRSSPSELAGKSAAEKNNRHMCMYTHAHTHTAPRLKRTYFKTSAEDS